MKTKLVLFAATAAITACGLASAGPPIPFHDLERTQAPTDAGLVAGPTDAVIRPADNRFGPIIGPPPPGINAPANGCVSDSLIQQIACSAGLVMSPF